MEAGRREAMVETWEEGSGSGGTNPAPLGNPDNQGKGRAEMEVRYISGGTWFDVPWRGLCD